MLYHSRALVFLAQATLDLGVKGGDCAFHKCKFRRELAGKSEEFRRLVEDHEDFVKELTDYRMKWIHRVPGRRVLTLQEDGSLGYTVPSIQR